MKVVILAGGYGTRLSEHTDLIPKPMVEIGNRPILWHIMKLYSSYGYNDFIILLGYKGYVIKDYFVNYFLRHSDVSLDISSNELTILNNFSEPWKITMLETGLGTMTGGRIKKAEKYINNQPFFLTYGDGVSDVNINELFNSHKLNNKLLTITSVQPEGKFGALEIDKDNNVTSFNEKPKGDGSWINGGFFVCEPEVLNYINNDECIFEDYPLKEMAKNNQIYTFILLKNHSIDKELLKKIKIDKTKYQNIDDFMLDIKNQYYKDLKIIKNKEDSIYFTDCYINLWSIPDLSIPSWWLYIYQYDMLNKLLKSKKINDTEFILNFKDQNILVKNSNINPHYHLLGNLTTPIKNKYK